MTQSLRVSMQATFILHRRPFRETSVILDALTEEYGKVALLAKGVRGKRSNVSAILQPFTPIQCSWFGRSGLYTLTDAETLQAPLSLTGKPLYCAMYLSELICRLLHAHDPHPQVFADYRAVLDVLVSGNDIEQALRYFEFSLLQVLGYGIQTDYEALSGAPVQAEKLYNYILEQGPCEVGAGTSVTCKDALLIQGATLLALAEQQLQDQQQLREAKLLMRHAIQPYLGGKPLKSRALFQGSKSSSKL